MWPEVTLDFSDYRRAVQASITLLSSFSLISKNLDASLSLHPLVHDWCRDRMSVADQQSGCRQAIQMLPKSVKRNFKTEDYAFRRSLVSHVHACLRVYDNKDEEFDDKTIHAWCKMALILKENGSIRDALQLIEQAVELGKNKKSKLSKDHPATLMNNLASLYSMNGQNAKALKLTEQVVELRKSKLGQRSSRYIKVDE